MTNGVDMALWQDGIDYELLKREGKEFAIIKCGGNESGKFYKDPLFEKHYKGVTNVGLHVGAFFYGGANTEAEAVSEAQYCASLLAGKKFDYPIFYDVEQTRMCVGIDGLTKIVRKFCETMENLGYWCGFYTSLSWYKWQMKGAELAERFSFWFAYWSDTMYQLPNVQMWQGGKRMIGGIDCDYDECYVDYPSLIIAKGKNGYSKEEPKPTPKPTPTKPKKKSVDEIAKEVIQGKWGVYPERKKKLEAAGYNYNEVQKRVDELMK